jgi:hypothetical protein
MAKTFEKILIIGAVGLGIWYLFTRTSAADTGIGGGVASGYTPQALIPSYSVMPIAYDAPAGVSPTTLQTLQTQSGLNYPIGTTIQIKEDISGTGTLEPSVRPYKVVTTSGSRSSGSSMSGGGTSSGLAISATPSTYTTMSSGFAKLASKYGLV